MTDSGLDRWIRELFRVEGDPGGEAPVERMWSRIEADVEKELATHVAGRAATRGESRFRSRIRPFFVPSPVLGWAMAAALVLAVATATLVVLERSGTTDGSVAVSPAAQPALAVVADYERAIAEMQAEAETRGSLSESGELTQALQVVDRAIEETRTALERRPTDPYYKDHLIRNLEIKLSILEGSLRL